MAITQAQIEADVASIWTDQAATDITEAITIGGVAFVAVRARKMTAEQLRGTGWEAQYQFTVYTQGADATSAAIGDVVTMAVEGELRVLGVDPGPAGAYVALHLGSKFQTDM